MRVFPISNWTELDVWQYIAREKLELPQIYFAHERQVIPRNGLLVPLTDLTPPREGETVETQIVRFRTVGDISCTCPVSSDAATVEAIIAKQRSHKLPNAAQPAWMTRHQKHRWKNVKKKDISNECR
jgi:sulfate adenylyltransferase subunit 2